MTIGVKKTKKILFNILYPLITLSVILIIWVIAAAATRTELILPSPFAVLKSLGVLFTEKEFYKAFLFSFLRSLAAFAISFSLALVLSILSRIFPTFYKLINPLISILRALPTVAIVLLLIIWTNTNWAAIIVALLVIMPTLFAAIYSSLINLDNDLILMCRVFNVPKRRMVSKMFMPLLLPDVLLSAASGLSLNLKLIVAAEVIANTPYSLGGMMNAAKIYIATSRLLALTVMTVITAVIIEALLKLAVKPLIKWKGGQK